VGKCVPPGLRKKKVGKKTKGGGESLQRGAGGARLGLSRLKGRSSGNRKCQKGNQTRRGRKTALCPVQPREKSGSTPVLKRKQKVATLEGSGRPKKSRGSLRNTPTLTEQVDLSSESKENDRKEGNRERTGAQQVSRSRGGVGTRSNLCDPRGERKRKKENGGGGGQRPPGMNAPRLLVLVPS